MIKPSRWLAPALVALLAPLMFVQACSSPNGPPAPAAGSCDASFRQLAREILEFVYKRDPSGATRLGIHKYDDTIADRSAAAIKENAEAIKSFQTRLDAVDAESLSLEAQLDLEQTKRALGGTGLG